MPPLRKFRLKIDRLPKLYRSRGGYRTCGRLAVWRADVAGRNVGLPQAPHGHRQQRAKVTNADPATNRFRIKPSPIRCLNPGPAHDRTANGDDPVNSFTGTTSHRHCETAQCRGQWLTISAA